MVLCQEEAKLHTALQGGLLSAADNLIGSYPLWGLTMSQLVTFIAGRTLDKVNLPSDPYIGNLAFGHVDLYNVLQERPSQNFVKEWRNL